MYLCLETTLCIIFLKFSSAEGTRCFSRWFWSCHDIKAACQTGLIRENLARSFVTITVMGESHVMGCAGESFHRRKKEQMYFLSTVKDSNNFKTIEI